MWPFAGNNRASQLCDGFNYGVRPLSIKKKERKRNPNTRWSASAKNCTLRCRYCQALPGMAGNLAPSVTTEASSHRATSGSPTRAVCLAGWSKAAHTLSDESLGDEGSKECEWRAANGRTGTIRWEFRVKGIRESGLYNSGLSCHFGDVARGGSGAAISQQSALACFVPTKKGGGVDNGYEFRYTKQLSQQHGGTREVNPAIRFFLEGLARRDGRGS